MKKRYLKLCLLTLLALICCAPAASASVKIGDLYYNLYSSSKTASVTSSIYNISGDLVIPSAVDYDGATYSVTEIGRRAFYNRDGLTSVTIPNSVTEIGSSAFYGCTGLTSVTIPNSVTVIGSSAFCGCSGLTSVTIPNSVTTIYNNTFRGCLGLTSVTIPSSVTTIYDYAFRDCSALTSVNIEDLAAWCNIKFYNEETNPLYYAHHLFLNGIEVKDLVIPDSVTTINTRAFICCSGLTSVTIPNSVTEIGYSAFKDCDGITSVTIGNSITSIDNYAFYSCNDLTSVHINDLAAWCNIKFGNKDSNPLYYANYLYLNSQEVKDLVIPDSVTTINDFAFSCCAGLTSVTFPNSVTEIGDYAFVWCSRLTSLTIPNSVTKIGHYAFNLCNSLTEIYCLPEIPPTITDDTFDDQHYNNATLNVPTGKVQDYKLATGWCRFSDIKPYDFSGVDDIATEGGADGVKVVGYYNTHGIRADVPWQGINIAVYSDGTRRKLVK